MPEVQDPPQNQTSENATRKAGLSKWMQGLQKELPTPSLGSGRTEPPPSGDGKQPDQADPERAAGGDPVDAKPAGAADPGAAAEPQKPAAVAKPAGEPAKEGEGEDRQPRSAKEWKSFVTTRKAEAAEYQKQLAERDTKIKELEAKTAGPLPPEIQKQIDGLKKENDDYSKQLRLLAVTQHPKFKDYFGAKVNGALNQLKSVVPLDKLDSVTKLLQSPDSDAKNEELNALMEEMTPLQRVRFNGVINSLDSIATEREAEVSRAQQDYEQMVAHAKTEREQRQAGFTRSLDETVKTMQDAKAGRPEYQLREGDAAWNEAVMKRIESGRQLITGTLPPEVMFKAAFDAAAYPDVLTGYKAALGEVDKLKKQIAAMGAANPTVQSPKRAEGAAEPRMPKESRPMDYTTNWVKKFGEAMRGD